MVLGWVVSSYTTVAEAIMALFSSGGENSDSRNIMREELIKTTEIEIASRGPTLEEDLIECEKNLDSMDEKLKLMSERKLISVHDIRKMFDDIIKKYNTVVPGSYGRTFANEIAPFARTLEEKVASNERMLENNITLIRLKIREQKALIRRLKTIIREYQDEFH